MKEVVASKKLKTTAKTYNLNKMALQKYVLNVKEKENETKISSNFKSSPTFTENKKTD